ncbi:MAG TPA: hypothetical protein PKC87_01920 [Candidatus Absconditabacterales bacterium]|nr:hypothetical protein [Candidatus Absconditabacterales bacterium]
MANIPIWNGSSHFQPGQTPFGFYDTDSEFTSSADKVASFCAIRLGYPLMDVELQSGSFYACFEEAVTTYGNEVYQAQAVQNYLSIEGSDTGTPLNNSVISSNLNSTIRISQNYATEAGIGGNVTLHKGMLHISASVQNYDLKQWALEQGISGSIEIRKVFYEAPPAILRYFDPYAGTGTGIQSLMDAFDFGSYSPGVNFLLMPASYDVLKVQAIEFNDQIRKSAYSFELHNNVLRLLPVPTREGVLWFEYYKISEKGNVDDSSNTAGGASGASGPVTNISNVPFENPTYSQINSIGRQWIYRYTLALAKELLAYVRGKYTTVPIPGSEATLNQQDLLSDARAEKEALLQNLRDILEGTSKTAQLERKSKELEFLSDVLGEVPMVIYVG